MNAMQTNPLSLTSRKEKRQRKNRVMVLIFSFLMLFLSFACSDKNRQQPDRVELNWNFNPGHEGWSGDFAEYPLGEEELYELLFEVDTLPLPLDQNQQSLKLSGNNLNGELFMFAKKRITGLDPNAAYFTTVTVGFASNMPGKNLVEDSPGSLVYLSAGASPDEPLKVNGENNVYEMNIGKCNLSENGENMIVLGNFTNDTDQPVYALNILENENPFRSVTNDKGELWVIIGIDSALPAPTTAYLNSVRVELF